MEFIMKKQIVTLMIGASILAVSPAWAMEDEKADGSKTSIQTTISQTNKRKNEQDRSKLPPSLQGVPRAFQGFSFATREPQEITLDEWLSINKAAQNGNVDAQKRLAGQYLVEFYFSESPNNGVESEKPLPNVSESQLSQLKSYTSTSSGPKISISKHFKIIY
jgi:hypothetical protein